MKHSIRTVIVPAHCPATIYPIKGVLAIGMLEYEAHCYNITHTQLNLICQYVPQVREELIVMVMPPKVGKHTFPPLKAQIAVINCQAIAKRKLFHIKAEIIRVLN